MTPAVDPTVRLALALSSSRGRIRRSPGLRACRPRQAYRPGARSSPISSPRSQPWKELSSATIPSRWYRGRFGEEPDYSTLLEELATSPTQRSELLRGYFEPTDEQRRQGLRVPGASHHALAQLAARGYITVFLTTNFDRLLEHALERAGVEPTTLSTPDSLEGTGALARNRCTVIKVNGDYLDTRFKNTPAELDSYHPAIERLLDRVLDEYGLIVCGWSADWDTALRRAFERAMTHRYATFWAARRPPTGEAARLFDAAPRRARHHQGRRHAVHGPCRQACRARRGAARNPRPNGDSGARASARADRGVHRPSDRAQRDRRPSQGPGRAPADPARTGRHGQDDAWRSKLRRPPCPIFPMA